MNKKGGTLSVIVWVVSVFVIIFFLAGYLYSHNLLTDALVDAGNTINTDVVNLTDAAQKVIVPVNSAMSSLTWISFIMIVALAFSILIENYYVREHPVLIFVHLMILILAIVGSIYISNAYESFLGQGLLSGSLTQFTASSYIALWLPLWVAIIGIFGMILLVINSTKDPQLTVRGGI